MVAQHDAGEAVDRAQRPSQIVRHRVGKGFELLVCGFQLRRALSDANGEILFALPQCLLGALSFGDCSLQPPRHLVERARKLPDLVPGGNVEPKIEVAGAYDRGAIAQLCEWPGYASEC